MKKAALSIAAVLFLFTLILLGTNAPARHHEEKYCAKMKDGVVKVMHQGAPINTEVTLANGTKIMTDGTILKPDGTNVKLKEGECIDKNGKIESDVQTEQNGEKKEIKKEKNYEKK